MQAPVDVELQLCYPSPRAREIDRKAVEALAASIKDVGLLSAITVRKVQKSRNGIFCDAFEVIAGMHRVKAFRWLQKTHIPAVIVEVDDLRAELMLIDENLRRNDLTTAERSAQQARRKRIWQELHPETKRGGDRGNQHTCPKLANGQVGQEPPVKRYDAAAEDATGDSARKVRRDVHRGEALGDDALAKVARTSLDKGEELDALAKLKKEAPEKCEALIERAAAGEKVSAKVEAKKIARQQREAELGAKQRSLPQQKFGVILADPEWKWKPWSDAGMDRGVENTYPTSETTDIAARDVQSIAADDCVLVLWARADMLPEALQVLTAWGFRYVAQRVWRKSRMSTGYWFRYDHELVLIGSRGKPVAPAMGTQERSVFEGEPAVPGLNSSKPECIAEWIEHNWPNTPKIELNRRGPARPGWAAWGYEAEQTNAETQAAQDPSSQAVHSENRSTEAPPSIEAYASPHVFDGVRPLSSERTETLRQKYQDSELDIPNCIRRDANNRAPFHEPTGALPPLCDRDAPVNSAVESVTSPAALSSPQEA